MIRARGLLAALMMLLLAGCGGSVADRDREQPPAAQEPEPPSPFCAAIFASSDSLAPLGSLSGGGSIPPEELTPTADAVRLANSDLLAASPPEIREDVQTYVQVIERQLDAVVADGGSGDALAAGSPLAAEIDTPENVAANERLQAYVSETCAPGGS